MKSIATRGLGAVAATKSIAARGLGAVALTLVAVYAIHWAIEMIAFSLIGALVFSGYRHMSKKLRDEKQKTLAVQVELDTARLLLKRNGLIQEDGVERKPSLEQAR